MFFDKYFTVPYFEQYELRKSYIPYMNQDVLICEPILDLRHHYHTITFELIYCESVTDELIECVCLYGSTEQMV